ncbi:MAG: class I SAM-dependent methyltransferase [Pyrinomonadaceae bacterium]
MSALTDRLRERIRRDGPITFHDWMKAALYDPEQGYYCRSDRKRWGREGDYRTSPERSVLFASTFARYFAKLFLDLGSPRAWTIVEAGAGAGHFAEGVLETLERRFPPVFTATTYCLDETSADSRARAAQQLARFGDKAQFRHLEELNRLDRAIIISNELLDAFPVHRLVMRENELAEFYVGVNGVGSFEWTIGKPSTKRLNEHFSQLGIRLEEGQKAEANLSVADWFELAVGKIDEGFLITLDYGAEARELYDSHTRPEGTLRSFERHQFASDVLQRPGEQDITSSIDWSFVKKVGANLGLEVVAFERQDRFLLNAGLIEEMELRTSEIEGEAERLSLRTNAREMILPGGLAGSFQVLVQKKNKPRINADDTDQTKTGY